MIANITEDDLPFKHFNEGQRPARLSPDTPVEVLKFGPGDTLYSALSSAGAVDWEQVCEWRPSPSKVIAVILSNVKPECLVLERYCDEVRSRIYRPEVVTTPGKYETLGGYLVEIQGCIADKWFGVAWEMKNGRKVPRTRTWAMWYSNGLRGGPVTGDTLTISKKIGELK